MATIDPVTQGFWVRGVTDTTYKNLNINGGVWGLRHCTNIIVDGGACYGNAKGDCCVVGSDAGYPPSKNITIKNIHWHDMTINDPSQHHQALYVSCVTGITIEGCTFGPNIYGNTSDLFFTGWEIAGNARDVIVRNCHFLPPTNGTRTDAIQWNDVNGGFVNHLYENNLFDGAQAFPGTLKKRVTNFVFGVNYGTQPSDNTINYAKGLGVVFKELPFRPKSQWPGASTPVPTPTPPPGTDPCADVKAALTVAQTQNQMLADANQALQQKINAARTALQ